MIYIHSLQMFPHFQLYLQVEINCTLIKGSFFIQDIILITADILNV